MWRPGGELRPRCGLDGQPVEQGQHQGGSPAQFDGPAVVPLPQGPVRKSIRRGRAAGLPIPFNGSSVNLYRSTSGRVTWDHTISPRIINTFRMSYQKESQWLATQNSQTPDDKWNEKLQIPELRDPTVRCQR